MDGESGNSESFESNPEQSEKVPEVEKIESSEFSGEQEEKLLGIIDELGGKDTSEPRESLEALAAADLNDNPDLEESPQEQPVEDTKETTEEETAPEIVQDESLSDQGSFEVIDGIGAKFDIEQVIKSGENQESDFARNINKLDNVAEALQEYRSNPSQESAQKYFDIHNKEAGKRMIPWGKPEKPCPHGNYPTTCTACNISKVFKK